MALSWHAYSPRWIDFVIDLSNMCVIWLQLDFSCIKGYHRVGVRFYILRGI